MIYVRFETDGTSNYLTRFYFSSPEWRITEVPSQAHPFETVTAARAAIEAFGLFDKRDRVLVRFPEGDPDA